ESLAGLQLAILELERRSPDAALARTAAIAGTVAKMGEGSEAPACAAINAVARLMRGDKDALADVDAAVSTLERIDAKGLLALALNFVAELDLDASRWADAERRGTRALAAAERIGRPNQVAVAHAVLARAAAATGRSAEAKAHLDAMKELAETPLALSFRARAALAAAASRLAT
ncbi:MAG TPA: hypothetical protein VMV18_13430, partial [bacterium]|nr:hypothetical protein [bacterium]